MDHEDPLTGQRRDVTPDDPRAVERFGYVLAGLFAIPLLAFGLGALVVPPPVVYALITKGFERGNTAYLIFGVLLALLWLLMLRGAIRSLFGPPKVKYGSVRPPGA